MKKIISQVPAMKEKLLNISNYIRACFKYRPITFSEGDVTSSRKTLLLFLPETAGKDTGFLGAFQKDNWL